MAALLVCGCSVTIEGYEEENTDHEVSFQYTTPIAPGQVGRNTLMAACTNEMDCTPRDVALMGVAIDHPEVLMTTPTIGAKTWDATALAPGSATVSVMADNEGIEQTGTQLIEVLEPDAYELVPAGLLARVTAPTLVAVPRTCASPLRFATNGLGTFAYKLMAGAMVMKGSGFYPFMSEELTPLQPFDRGNDGGGIQFIAGATPTASTITSMMSTMPMTPMPIEIIESNITAIALSEQERAPTPEGETLIWSEVLETDKPICFDNNTRVIASTTPTVCTIVDGRPLSQQYKGPGPYVISWHSAGTCTISVTIRGTTITTTKDYTQI